MAISLESIVKTKHSAPPRIIVHGAEKVGKSTLFASAEDCVFIQTEDGLKGIDAQAFPLAEKLDDAFEAIHTLQTEDHPFKVLVIDSADWLERLIHDQVCQDHGVKTIEMAAGGFGKGYGEALNYWRQILSMLDDLNSRKGMIVAFICHSRLVQVSDPENEAYDSWKLKLHEPKSGNQGALSLLSEWADIIGFARKKVLVKKSTTSDKHRAIDGKQRELLLEGSPAFLAGNRYNLEPSIPLEWTALEEQINNA